MTIEGEIAHPHNISQKGAIAYLHWVMVIILTVCCYAAYPAFFRRSFKVAPLPEANSSCFPTT
ncbi:MAG: hypothetical protein F6K42_12670 [Leptolyngbya sp. SIO1D8]|nr:hypothetical protein [Leptolyngbya sp. SIO1D8]